MIIRLVRMSFHPEKVEKFLANFKAKKAQIRAFEGCLHLELWRDTEQPHIFTTYSHWQSEEALNHYRQSELFKTTWANTKVLFNEQPVATSFHREILVTAPK